LGHRHQCGKRWRHGTARRDALEALCQKYWPPLYLFVRRHGHSVEDAQDLVQGFFSFLLEKNHIEKADSERGRFRTFLLNSLRGYITNERRKQERQKRGGGILFIPLQDLHRVEATIQSAEPVPNAADSKTFLSRNPPNHFRCVASTRRATSPPRPICTAFRK
jgi:RNA polymerase sigma-70 factor (ECF subfamily)